MKVVVSLLILLLSSGFVDAGVKLYDKNGSEVSLPQDRLIILNFMAYSCGHCMAEIPVFKKVLAKPQYKEMFAIYGFAIDGKENNLKDPYFPIYTNNPRNNVVFPLMGTPTTYIIDPQGKKLQIIYGSITERSLEEFLSKSLEKYRK